MNKFSPRSANEISPTSPESILTVTQDSPRQQLSPGRSQNHHHGRPRIHLRTPSTIASCRTELLEFVNHCLQKNEFQNKKIDNFTNDWNDGKVFFIVFRELIKERLERELQQVNSTSTFSKFPDLEIFDNESEMYFSWIEKKNLTPNEKVSCLFLNF